jgi:hypothetical protein
MYEKTIKTKKYLDWDSAHTINEIIIEFLKNYPGYTFTSGEEPADILFL